MEEVYLFSVTTDADGNEVRTRLAAPAATPPDGEPGVPELTLTHGDQKVGVGCHATMRGSLDSIDDMKVKRLCLRSLSTPLDRCAILWSR